MGIPSYFVHVVKTIKHIVKPLSALRKGVHNLYMDCNGIIYDAVRVLKVSDFKKQDAYEAAIMQHVCDKITEYVEQVKPSNRVFLTFDGVAPVAKLNQQRERRYKTWYTAEIEKAIDRKHGATVNAAAPAVDREYSWTTACITPGTRFMDKLHERMSKYVADTAASNASDTTGIMRAGIDAIRARPAEYMLSSSKEPGEGEHKIFEYIRANPAAHREQVTLVYGLDADLIMLTLNHLHISSNIYLYRETPEFIQSIDSQLKPNEQYYMDIPHMSDCIAHYMTTGTGTGGAGADVDPAIKICPIVKKYLVYDYIFMFFLMGNDFMPHFPSMNIRTTGPDTVMHAYKITFQNTLAKSNATDQTTQSHRSFIYVNEDNDNDDDALRINWDSVREFMQCIAEVEHSRLLSEHALRDKRSRMGSSGHQYERATLVEASDTRPATLHSTGVYNSISELLVAKCKSAADVLHIPLKERGLEHYIAPKQQGWEERYYMALFGERITDRRCQAYCINYLEGLEWTFQYYTRGCVDWRWKYKYSYPPLLVDLVRFIPMSSGSGKNHRSIVLIEPKPKDPIRDTEQLRYVLPPAFQSALIPADAATGSSGLSDLSVVSTAPFGLDDVHFKWAYCKYFWEAHIAL